MVEDLFEDNEERKIEFEIDANDHNKTTTFSNFLNKTLNISLNENKNSIYIEETSSEEE